MKIVLHESNDTDTVYDINIRMTILFKQKLLSVSC